MKTSRALAISTAVVLVGGIAYWRLEPFLMHKAAQAILQSQKEETGDINVGQAPPDFSLKDADGRTITLSKLRGKVVLLNFWATWCGPCKYEIPWFIEFQNDLGPRGFTVLGVSMDDNGWEAVRPYMASAKMNYPVVLGNESITRKFGGIEALPTTIVIGRDGKIAGLHLGLASKNVYRKEILALLGDSGGTR